MTHRIALLVLPDFNAATTFAFVDPFRVANYLSGETLYTWQVFSNAANQERASNGLTVSTQPIDRIKDFSPDTGVVSSSWTPEKYYHDDIIFRTLRDWYRHKLRICGLDTGAFLLARAGLLTGGRATTHYEHIDAFQEVYPDITCTEDLICEYNTILTCAGGIASADLALHILQLQHGDEMANACARYILHDRIRAPGEHQNVGNAVPIGHTTPSALRGAIQYMEAHLETPVPIPEIAQSVGLSQRQLSRLFQTHTGSSPVRYYRNIRLDRGRSLITQTEMSVLAAAIACGFETAEYFTRAYKERFQTTPRADRVQGRIPFEYRAWPMHSIPSKK